MNRFSLQPCFYSPVDTIAIEIDLRHTVGVDFTAHCNRRRQSFSHNLVGLVLRHIDREETGVSMRETSLIHARAYMNPMLLLQILGVDG